MDRPGEENEIAAFRVGGVKPGVTLVPACKVDEHGNLVAVPSFRTDSLQKLRRLELDQTGDARVAEFIRRALELQQQRSLTEEELRKDPVFQKYLADQLTLRGVYFDNPQLSASDSDFFNIAILSLRGLMEERLSAYAASLPSCPKPADEEGDTDPYVIHGLTEAQTGLLREIVAAILNAIGRSGHRDPTIESLLWRTPYFRNLILKCTDDPNDAAQILDKLRNSITRMHAGTASVDIRTFIGGLVEPCVTPASRPEELETSLFDGTTEPRRPAGQTLVPPPPTPSMGSASVGPSHSSSWGKVAWPAAAGMLIFAGGVAAYKFLTPSPQEKPESVLATFTAPDDQPTDTGSALTVNDSEPSSDVTHDLDSAEGTYQHRGNYEAIVKLVASDPDIPEEEKDLYVAKLNQGMVDIAAPASSWRALMPQIHDTPGAFKVIRANNLAWGGWRDVWVGVDRENAKRLSLGQDPIDTPSEYFDYLENGPFPHPDALALDAAQESSLIHDKRVVKDIHGVEDRLGEAADQKVILADELKQNTPERPSGNSFWQEKNHGLSALTDAPDSTALAQGSAVEMVEEPEADMAYEIVEDEGYMDALEAPEPTFAPSDSQTEAVGVAVNSELTGLADWMIQSVAPLTKNARAKNKARLPGFLAGVAEDLRELATRFDGFTDSGKEVALLDLRQKYFKRLTDKNQGLVAAYGTKYSDAIRDHSKAFLAKLAELMPPVPEVQGVEGVQARTQNAVLRTLPNIFRA